MLHRLVVVVSLLAAAVLPSAASAETALNVIPHGQVAPGVPWANAPGILPADTQAKMYDRLTPLFRDVGPAQLEPSADGTGYFKSAALVPQDDPSLITSQIVSGTSPSAGPVSATIKRDAYGVPHIYSDTDAGAIFGSGYVVATDQGLLLSQARRNGVAALVDLPGVTAIGLILGLYDFKPNPEVVAAEAARQTRAIEAQGAQGEQLLDDIDTYLAGINARQGEAGSTEAPFTRADIYALNAVKAQYLGEGGGAEVGNAEFLDGLSKRFGRKQGMEVFRDLQARNDPEASVTTTKSFPAQTRTGTRGMVRLKGGTYRSAAVRLPGGRLAVRPPRHEASNILIVSGDRSATGAPLFAGGPQIGYNYPGLTYEVQLSSPSIQVRGASSAPFPGYMLIGRGTDFAWSLTSAGADIKDTYAETLCGRNKYRFKGRCRAMERVTAGTITKGEQSSEATFLRTIHGPVIGYAVDRRTGKRVALTQRRSSAGRETLDLLYNQALTFGRVKNAADYIEAAQRTPQTFNSFYANATEAAFYTAGRLPRRPKGVDPTLPVRGTGKFEWRGVLPASAHPQAVGQDEIVNWNNKPARNFPAGDDRFGSEGGIQRNELLTSELDRFEKPTLADVLAAENAGATQDVRIARFWPTLKAMLDRGKAPDELSAAMVGVLDAWHQAGGSRVDSDGDGKIDAAGAPILDAAWDGMANAAMCARLGRKLCDALAERNGRYSTPPGGQYGGWHQYMDKDFRTILGRKVRGKYSTRFCGKGKAARCARGLWSALSAAGKRLAADQGSQDPAAWRAPVTTIKFSPIDLTTIQYTNRPSGIHQVMTFK